VSGRAFGTKMGNDGGGLVTSLDGMAPMRMVSVSASAIFPCAIKSRRKFLVAPAQPGSPGKRAVKWLCLYVCVKSEF